MFLSENVAWALFWISILLIFLSIFVLVLDSDYNSYHYNKVDLLSTTSKWVMAFIFSIIFMYSVASLFYADSQNQSENVAEVIKDKYGIEVEDKILNDAIKEFSISSKNKDSVSVSKIIKIDGEEFVIVQRGKEFYLLGFKNGLLVEQDSSR